MSEPSSSPEITFAQERRERLSAYGQDGAFQSLSQDWLRESMQRKYVYNFDWLGRPIIQYPQDMWAVQDLIWRVRPDLVIETGIAHGGSLILSASMLAMLDMCDAIEAGTVLDPSKSRRKVLGLDIDIRAHNRAAIEQHPMGSRIQMLQGSSIAPEVVQQVHAIAQQHGRILVFLDSMHTHEHVLAELVGAVRGSTRRVCTNLEMLGQKALENGQRSVVMEDLRRLLPNGFITGESPKPRSFF